MLERAAKDVDISVNKVKQVVELIEEGNTVPFIARYRKEQTGGLDEVQIRDIVERWEYITQLEGRKQEVTRLIEEQGKLTDELRSSISEAEKLQQVEDIYRPYKQKRRTRATVAKEKGLESFAERLFSLPREIGVEKEAEGYLSEELPDTDAVISGAKDIIAEWVSDDAEVRGRIRERAFRQAVIESVKKPKGADDEKGVFAMYYEYSERVSAIVPHRILALNRGEKEDTLRISVKFPVEAMVKQMNAHLIRRHGSPAVPVMEEAIEDAYLRLIEPSLERECRSMLTEKAEEQAIKIFAENLQSLLLQPPIKGQIVLGVDPAFRTGCKLAAVDETGKVLDTGVIYPTAPHNKVDEAKRVIKTLIAKFGVKMVAIGNGTASRETEQFIANCLRELEETIYYVIVNEAGASVYSASELAREEFPDLQVEERSAVSIARRLQDPLAELVKIDPKSVGVGQYQHDVAQKRLNESLDFVVETVVNRVGVNVNTASSALLQHVAGLSKTQAKNIVKLREEGVFTSRTALKKVPRLGAKTYEQCIGFLRISEGKNPLDATSIHPESYKPTEALLEAVGSSISEIGTEAIKEKIANVDFETMVDKLEVGLPTLRDIVDALVRPGRDPRDEVAAPLLKQDVLKLEDLHTGMELQGTIRNVVDFGAFVDVGVKQDGLVHISRLTKRFVKHPMDVVSVGDIVTVWVTSIDAAKGRIGLSMLAPKDEPVPAT
ncbi:Tex family protein [Shouchella shacheensis]|uniref:Tex family protein n=1 Tax=Shouchella shacheensis TaxID=1649580 RepID=UPI00073FEB7F|nr:Tex family protein [Shouchella shacheensis]